MKSLSSLLQEAPCFPLTFKQLLNFPISTRSLLLPLLSRSTMISSNLHSTGSSSFFLMSTHPIPEAKSNVPIEVPRASQKVPSMLPAYALKIPETCCSERIFLQPVAPADITALTSAPGTYSTISLCSLLSNMAWAQMRKTDPPKF